MYRLHINKNIKSITTTLLSLCIVAQSIPENQWTNIDTINTSFLSSSMDAKCGASDYFAFGAYRGNKNALVIEFEGGGACGSYEQCIRDMYTQRATCIKDKLPNNWSVYGSGLSGIERHDNTLNPVKDWNHVFVPYCTCDFHAGSGSFEFPIPPGQTKSGKFNFNGFKNLQFVMDWILTRYKQAFIQNQLPEKVLITGCSAGGYASNIHFEYILKRLPGYTKVYTFVDSAYGKLGLLQFGYSQFLGTESLETNEVLAQAINTPNSAIDDVVGSLADKYPTSKHASFSFYNDPLLNARDTLVDQVRELESADRCNTRSILADGSEHCIVPFGGFYSKKLPNSNVKLIDYLRDFIDDKCVPSYINSASNINEKDYCSPSSSCANRQAQESDDKKTDDPTASVVEDTTEKASHSERAFLNIIVGILLAGIINIGL